MKWRWALCLVLGISCGSLGAQETPSQAKPEWFACASSEECVVVSGVCNWEAVRRSALDEYEKFNAALRPSVECAPRSQKKPGTICATGRCILGGPAAKRLPAPQNLRGEPQDNQAVRLQWDPVAEASGYFLYAAPDDTEKTDFFQENSEPLHQEFVIWDAPKTSSRRFRFKVTAVDLSDQESDTSGEVRVDLSASSANDPRPSRKK